MKVPKKFGYLDDFKSAADIITSCGSVDGSVCIICQKRLKCSDAFGPNTNLSCQEYVLDEEVQGIERVVIDVLTQT